MPYSDSGEPPGKVSVYLSCKCVCLDFAFCEVSEMTIVRSQGAETRLLIYRYELAPVNLSAAEQTSLRRQAVQRIARSREEAVAALRDMSLIRLAANVPPPPQMPVHHHVSMHQCGVSSTPLS